MADHLLLHRPVAVSKFVTRHSSYKLLLLLRFGLQLYFLAYRLSSCTSSSDPLNGYCFTALASETLFALIWLLSTTAKLFPVERETNPAALLTRYKNSPLPAVDIFVTTADHLKEPLLITMSTVLSALAVDYPVHKLACYVSDDGGSLFTFSALKETCVFARKWVPFCKKFQVEPRSPAAYFALKTSAKTLQRLEDRCFSDEWQEMKKEYDNFKHRIDTVTENCSAPEKLQFLLNESGPAWTANDSRQHPGLFQVLLDAEQDVNGDALPYLTYISREKRRHYKHHFKAGAMNTLTRVSGIMTNAPIILNLDCDMYINDSKVILHSMCFFMDPHTDKQTSFVQFPQCFEGVDEDDIYGNKMRSGMEIKVKGMDGIQGPPYLGTGCFHKRAALYGRDPDVAANADMDGGKDSVQKSSMSYECARDKFGRSSSLISSVQNVLESSSHYPKSARWGSSVIDEAKDVLSCTYEDRTDWGKEIGWIYGSATEDFLTGLKLHCRGWKSIYCTPPRPAFLGCAPANGHDVLTLRKRWYTGMLEVLFHKIYSPFLTKQSPGLVFLQRVIYIWICSIPLTCFPMLAYGALPALCLFNHKSIFPQVSDPAILKPIFLLLSIYGTSYYENALIDVGAREWWNSEQRMEAIIAVSSSPFAVFEVLLKVMGILETTFVVTPKDQKSSNEAAQMGFILNNSSPLFIPPTVLVVMNLAGLAVGAGRAMAQGGGWSVGELLCGFWVIFVLAPFFKGLYKRGASGLPTSTVVKSALIASFILGLSRILS